jgi:GAF domain
MPEGSADSQVWRSLLGALIEEQDNLSRIADVSGIRQGTLQRWVQKLADPSFIELQALLAVLPEHRQGLLDQVRVEFPDFTYSDRPENGFTERRAGRFPRKYIPSAFYDRVLYTYTTSLPSLRFWSICNLALKQALIQLDPERLGMAISVAQCMPPSQGGKVRCLWERLEVGTPPWRADLTQKTLFLGVESLAGYAVATNYPAVIQNLAENADHLPARRVEHRESVASFPLLLGGYVAGCLTVSSVEKDFFSYARLDLIESYTRLLMPAFHNEHVWEQDAIDLSIMPSAEVQMSHMETFRQRVNETLISAASRDEPMTMLEAELSIRQQMVEELLQLSSRPSHET